MAAIAMLGVAAFSKTSWATSLRWSRNVGPDVVAVHAGACCVHASVHFLSHASCALGGLAQIVDSGWGACAQS